ncbi:hydrolase [Streptomyces sp. MST-110588]|nr:hydrolase [Streptomyces sp. MST-110588]
MTGVVLAVSAATVAATAPAVAQPEKDVPGVQHVRKAAPADTAQRLARPTLPAPTGPYAVGTTSLHLVDHGRADPWLPSRPYRELMVSVRYPARSVAGHPRAPHMLPAEAAGFDAVNSLQDVPKGRVDWAATRSHAHRDAPVLRPFGRRLPVLLYSPGAGDPRSLGTTLADDLASRGYAVVTIDHTYDATAVEFPGGRVERTRLPEEAVKAKKEGRMPELLKKTVAVDVADTRFVLDQVEALAAGRNPDAGQRRLPSGLRGALDPGRVGAFGQSAGGFTAALAMHDDRRIKAAANMDGVMGYTEDDHDPANPSTVATEGVDRPLLLMGMEGDDHHTMPSWGGAWRNSTGWHRDLTLTGSRHATFTDAGSLVPQIARQLGLPAKTVTENVGTVDPGRALAAQRAYMAAFFDRWLCGRDSHLLDGPSGRFPEMRFVS